ncbi:MAG: hypothetical protein HQL86_09615 [Magnetococcales bacterium]|nr:hypothetical protein [Magnetococcales bacterium]
MMIRRLILAVVLGMAIAAPAAAATKTDAEMYQERVEANKEWLKSIPDYEMRLYERIKKLNNRVTVTSNTIIVFMLALFVAAPFWFRFVLNRSGGLASSGVATGSGDPGPARDAARMAKLKANQILLAEMLTSVEDRLRETDERLAGMTGDRAELRATLERIRDAIKTIDAQLED